MSFTGDLEHLPIVDVIQLMHSARKSGVLSIRGRKGESQLVFEEGYIVSASHLDGSVRIGQVLVERGVLRQEDLDRALADQSQAGNERFPLIATLLQLGAVDEKDAYAGLQSLIELTIVEVLTWKKGTFLLEPNPDRTPDSYQFDPDRLNRGLNVDTQGVLMDALRIFDEKIRDGELSVEEDGEDPGITEEDLGLADLEQLERRIPGVFTSIDDRPSGSEPSAPAQPVNNLVRRLNELIAQLGGVATVPEVALAQLRYVGEIFPRALTLVIRGGELIAEKGIGLKDTGGREISSPLGYRFPLAGGALLLDVIDRGSPYWGRADDPLLEEHLFRRIGPPATAEVLLLPVRAGGRTVFLTFADFGDGQSQDVPVALLEMLSGQSGQALERILGKVKGER